MTAAADVDADDVAAAVAAGDADDLAGNDDDDVGEVLMVMVTMM